MIERRNAAAFTIVELMAVIVVIGILATIVVISVGNWRQQVAESEVKNDIMSLKSSMDGAKNFGEGYPVLTVGTIFDGTGDSSHLFKQSPNVKVTYSRGDKYGYCVDAVSTVSPSVYYFFDNTEQNMPQVGTCAGGVGAAPFDDSLPTEFPSISWDSRVTGIDVDSGTGVIYFAMYPPGVNGSQNIYSFAPKTDETKLIASGVETADLVFGGDGKLYIFSGVTGNNTVQSVNIASGAIANVSSTVIDTGSSLYKSGNTIYAVGASRILSFDLTSGTSQELYYTSMNIYSKGLTMVGSDLYFFWQRGFYKIPATGGSPTKIADIPTNATGSPGSDLEYKGGRFYMIVKNSDDQLLLSYDVATSQWATALSGLGPFTGVSYSTCGPPSDFVLYGNRAIYFSGAPADYNGCGIKSGKVRIYYERLD